MKFYSASNFSYISLSFYFTKTKIFHVSPELRPLQQQHNIFLPVLSTDLYTSTAPEVSERSNESRSGINNLCLLKLHAVFYGDTTCLEEFSFEFLSAHLVQLLAFDEALGHSLEVLLRDRSVLVEVDALEVGLHLTHPEVGHGRWQAVGDDPKSRRTTATVWRGMTDAGCLAATAADAVASSVASTANGRCDRNAPSVPAAARHCNNNCVHRRRRRGNGRKSTRHR